MRISDWSSDVCSSDLVDALSHFSHAGRLHGDVDAAEAQTGGRFKQHGAETLPPIFGRGVLLDVPRHVGAHAGAPGYEITRADLEQAARVAGIAIRRGDAVLVRTGWGRHWDDGKTYLDFEGGMPGPGVEAIDWLCSLGVKVVGSDTIAFEHIPAGKGLSELPGHKILLVDHGRSEEHTSELQSLMRISYAVFCLKKKIPKN